MGLSRREQAERNSFGFLGYFQSPYRISHLLVTIYLLGRALQNSAASGWVKPVADAPLGWCPEDPPGLQRAAAGWPLVPFRCLVCVLHCEHFTFPTMRHYLGGLNTIWIFFFASERVSRGLSLLHDGSLGVAHLHLLQLLTTRGGLCWAML